MKVSFELVFYDLRRGVFIIQRNGSKGMQRRKELAFTYLRLKLPLSAPVSAVSSKMPGISKGRDYAR